MPPTSHPPPEPAPLAATASALVVSIDGPAAAGKSTVARRLARDLGWSYLDTGAMYRALTLVALERGIHPADGDALALLATGLDVRVDPDGSVRVGERDVTTAIRAPEISRAVSEVAVLPAVRRVMVAHQRRFAGRWGRIVAEGRDIGTVVFPEAAVKIWLDAQAAERADRRLREERTADPARPLGAVRAEMEARDRRDTSRPVAPLTPAADAWRLDTTGLTLEQVFQAVRSHVRSRIPSGSAPPSSTKGPP